MKTAVIIGAGPAGLTAAYELLVHTDIHPIILEKDSIVGGLSRTVNFDGNRMDIGGHRFFTKSREVQELWDSIMPKASAPALDDRLLGRTPDLDPAGRDPETEDIVFLNRQRVSRILYLHKFFDYPVSLNPTTIRNLGLFRMTSMGLSYLHACFHKRPEKTLEDFMVNRFGEKLYQTLFRGIHRKGVGKVPQEPLRRLGQPANQRHLHRCGAERFLPAGPSPAAEKSGNLPHRKILLPQVRPR